MLRWGALGSEFMACVRQLSRIWFMAGGTGADDGSAFRGASFSPSEGSAQLQGTGSYCVASGVLRCMSRFLNPGDFVAWTLSMED